VARQKRSLLITLTTDFGSADHFVGAMKGVILKIAPRAHIVDITHEITPYGVDEATFVLAQTWSWFPQAPSMLPWSTLV
jgi:S-adenosylmethionine hydrolase